MTCPICNKEMEEVKDERGRLWAICNQCPNNYIIKYLEPNPPMLGDKVATEIM